VVYGPYLFAAGAGRRPEPPGAGESTARPIAIAALAREACFQNDVADAMTLPEIAEHG
jgi:hypothetical protein